MNKKKVLSDFLNAEKELLKIEGNELSSLVNHQGEKGRLSESNIRKRIRSYLPEWMKIGTGFIASADGSLSPQQDIIIYDGLYSVPIYESEVCSIFPIESVLATVEIKTTLTRAELKKSLLSSRVIRDMAETNGKHYLKMGIREIDGKGSVVTWQQKTSKLPPRYFIFSYKTSYKKADSFFKAFEDISCESNSHCHGLCVLEQEWFTARNAYGEDTEGNNKPFEAISQNGFQIFVHQMLFSCIGVKPATSTLIPNRLAYL